MMTCHRVRPSLSSATVPNSQARLISPDHKGYPPRTWAIPFTHHITRDAARRANRQNGVSPVGVFQVCLASSVRAAAAYAAIAVYYNDVVTSESPLPGSLPSALMSSLGAHSNYVAALLAPALPAR